MKTEHGNTIKVKLDTGAQANVLSEKNIQNAGDEIVQVDNKIDVILR